MAVIEPDRWIRRADLIAKKAKLVVAEEAGCFPLELRGYVHKLEAHKVLSSLQ